MANIRILAVFGQLLDPFVGPYFFVVEYQGWKYRLRWFFFVGGGATSRMAGISTYGGPKILLYALRQSYTSAEVGYDWRRGVSERVDLGEVDIGLQ